MHSSIRRPQRPTINENVKYFTTFQNTVADVLAERGWIRVEDINENKNENNDKLGYNKSIHASSHSSSIDIEWDFAWCDRDWVYEKFDHSYFQSWQRINHFRNSKELCRKDLMAKNIKRRKKLLEKENRVEEASSYNFLPTTFLLPKEYPMFVEEFKKSGGVWIMKPIGSAQGKGIFLFSKLSDISDWKTDYKSLRNPNSYFHEIRDGREVKKEVDDYIVQRYIQSPYLIGGKKFDLRLYVLVTSFSPLKVYQYRRGFARFTNSKYSSDIQHIYDSFMHLTNVAIQKTADNYDERTGGKMDLQAFKMYLSTKHGMDQVDGLFWEMQMIILKSLLAVQPVMINDRHCFELFGYDILIDENLKPWLLEVNASPSLSTDTQDDLNLKKHMLHGLLDIIDMTGQLSGDEEHVSGWDLVYDNGFIEVDSEQCGYTTFLGAAVSPSSYEYNIQTTRSAV